MRGHIEDKRRKLPSLEKSLLNALCAAFDLFEICARSYSCALVDIREGLLGANPYCAFMARGHRRLESRYVSLFEVCSNGFAALRAVPRYMSPSLEISDV